MCCSLSGCIHKLDRWPLMHGLHAVFCFFGIGGRDEIVVEALGDSLERMVWEESAYISVSFCGMEKRLHRCARLPHGPNC